jgi:membrane protease YdiL (CAAX protease family)
MNRLFLRSDGGLRSGWKFCLAIIIVFLSHWIAFALGRLFGLGTGSYLVAEAIYRTWLAALMLVAFTALELRLDGEPNPISAQGFPFNREAKPQFIKGLLLAWLLVAIGVLAILSFGSYEVAVFTYPTVWLKLVAVLWVLITAALAEEIAFRGYPFQKLVEGVGGFWATVLSALLFGVVHIFNPFASVYSFINTVLVGILLSLAYLRTRSLWLPWGFHLGWNVALGTLFGLPVSGLETFSVVLKGYVKGPEILTGGGYGLEASLTGALVLILGIVLLLKITRVPASADARQSVFPEQSI